MEILKTPDKKAYERFSSNLFYISHLSDVLKDALMENSTLRYVNKIKLAMLLNKLIDDIKTDFDVKINLWAEK